MRTKTNLTNTGLENSTTASKWADYGNTALTSKPTCTELDQPVYPCDAEEVIQRIVNHALNLLRNGYKNIFIRTVDTDVPNLLISYFSQFELDDVDVYAHVNSNKYFDSKAIIQSLLGSM